MAAAAILLVEDNPDDALLIRKGFERAGYNNPIYWVENGEEALHYLKGLGKYADRTAFPIPGLMLLDLKLPRLDGFEVLSWVRAHLEWRCLPVIILTTSFYGAEINRAYELGANSFLTKPADFVSYLEAIKNIGTFWLNSPLPAPGPFVPAPASEPSGPHVGASSETRSAGKQSMRRKRSSPPLPSQRRRKNKQNGSSLH